jgi:hypothetical protein
MAGRYAAEARWRFRGDAETAKLFMPEGRKVLGLLLNQLDLGKVPTGIRRVTNDQGVTFTVSRHFNGVPTIEIDTRSVRKVEAPVDLLQGFVVRPSLYGNLNWWGRNAYTILLPTSDDTGSAWLANEAMAGENVFDDETTFRRKKPYSNPWPTLESDPATLGAIGRWGNHDWRSGNGAWATYIHGPSNRYSDGEISSWAYSWVYMKGKRVFDIDVDLVDTPAAEDEPDLLTSNRLYVTGACVHRQGRPTLIVAITEHLALPRNVGRDWLIACPLKIKRTPGTPRDVSLARAPEYELVREETRVVHVFDWAEVYGDATEKDEFNIRPGHPTVFNQSGTECRRPRASLWVAAPAETAGGYYTTELVIDFEDLDDVSHELVTHLHRNTERTESSTTDAKPDYFTYFKDDTPPPEEAGEVGQTFGVSGVDAVVNRESEVGWLRTRLSTVATYEAPDPDEAFIEAVDYRDDEVVYARAEIAHVGSIEDERAATADFGGESTVANVDPTFYTDFTLTAERREASTSKVLVTDFHTLSIVDEATRIGSSTLREEGYTPIAETNTATIQTIDEAWSLIYLDLRDQWAVYHLERVVTDVAYSWTWAYGDPAPPTTHSATITTTETFRVVRGDEVLAESSFQTVEVANRSLTFARGGKIGSAAGTVPNYVVPGSYTAPPPRDYSVPANPGVTPNKEGFVQKFNVFQLSSVTPFGPFFDPDDEDYAWAIFGTPVFVELPASQFFHDTRFTRVAGSWVARGNHWAFSMAWPLERGEPNFLTMTSFGELTDAVGVEDDADDPIRFYPIFLMPPTQRVIP